MLDMKRLLRSPAPLTDGERGAILEIACLAVTADHEVHADELDAFRRLAEALDSRTPLDELVARARDREAADARLVELADALSPNARKVAYKAAYALCLADTEEADQEFEFDLQLIDALDLAQDDVDALVSEVREAIAA